MGPKFLSRRDQRDRGDLKEKLEAALTDKGLTLADVPAQLMPVLEGLAQEAQEAREARQKLAFVRSSVEALPNPIFIKNAQVEFVFFNQAYRDFFGLKEQENIGKRVQGLEYLPPADRKRYHAEDSEMVRSFSTIQYDMPFQKADRSNVDTLYWPKGFQVPGAQQRGLVGEIVDDLDHTLNGHGPLGHHQAAVGISGCQLGLVCGALHGILGRAVLDALLFIDTQHGGSRGSSSRSTSAWSKFCRTAHAVFWISLQGNTMLTPMSMSSSTSMVRTPVWPRRYWASPLNP